MPFLSRSLLLIKKYAIIVIVTKFDFIFPFGCFGGAMIKFIYGDYGTGKTTKILEEIAESTKNGIRSFLIIPDQEALQFERLTLSTLPPESQLTLEILSFSRLYNRVCREYGGLSYSYVSKPTRSLIMWKTLRHTLFKSKDYAARDIKDLSLAESMLSAINEFKANGKTPDDIQAVSDSLASLDPSLSDRLYDISTVYADFTGAVERKYSDASDDLAKLSKKLDEHDFFKGANVYFDSFYSFTSVQHGIIEKIFKTAENVTLTVPLPSYTDNGICNKGVNESVKRLTEAARRLGPYRRILLEENKRAKSPCLAYLSKNLWKLDAKKSDAPALDGSIVYEKCQSRYTEAEAVAAHITELLRNGARCRDIVVIARDTEKYRGIIDTALKKSGIPYFLDQKPDLTSMPSVKLIFSALRIKKYNWQRQDVLTYMKTGMCNVTTKDANLFEEYVNTWKINGSQFLDGPWTMNPDGIVDRTSERGKDVLRAANEVRKAVTEPLKNYFLRLSAAETMADMCRATYEYMKDAAIEKKLQELAKKNADLGDVKQAHLLLRIYEITLNTLADIGVAIGDEKADEDEFIHILRNVFDLTEVGSIPPSIDEVTIGSAAMLRTSNPKYAFVIGLCEGEFPAAVNDSGLFSKTDRKRFEEIEFTLSENSELRSSDELMYIQRAFSTPSEKLFVLTHSAEINGSACFPSLAFNRVSALFDKFEPHEYKLSDFDYLVPAPKNAAAIYRALDDERKRKALGLALEETIPHFSKKADISSSVSTSKISPETVKQNFDKTVFSSSTAFEKYAKCPFSYFCTDVLKLRSNPSSGFRSNNIGNFVHYLLEILIKKAIPSDPDEPKYTDEQLIELAEETVDKYLLSICPPSMIESKRMCHLYDRLKKLSLLLVKNIVTEFESSEFKPAFFELNANGKYSNPASLVFSLNEGYKISFTGKIDRVDIYKTKGGEVYIRIVDYKTGSKTFSISDISHGINIQMLLYLFTLCRSESVEFKKALGISPNASPLPAGVIYFSAEIPAVEAEDFADIDQTYSLAEKKIVRSGLLLDNDEILLAMNDNLDTDFLPLKKLRNGSISRDSLISAKGFDDIYNELEKTITEMGNKLISGNADADPIEYGDSPCEYCSAKPICRKKNNIGGKKDGLQLD